MNRLILTFLVSAFFIGTIGAQVTLPPGGANQKSVVKQYIGALTYVKVMYNSPDVTSPAGEDRTGKIWGQLVPYGLNDLGFGLRNPSPWRAGANENTTVYFSHDMKVQGQPIKAGHYGFHVIVEEAGPWTIILSKNTDAWGSFFYDESEDVLRVEATPEESEFNEWLTFEFVDRQSNYAVCALKWENKSLPFKIEVENIEELYVANLKEELQGQKGFTWTNWNAAANYCLQNNTHLEQGLEWAEASINAPFIGQENFQTLQTKAGILNQMRRSDEANEILMTAVDHPAASPFQIHGLGRQLIAQGNKEMALTVFTKSFDRYEGAWPTHVGMARGLSAIGKYDKALKHAQLALEQAPDQLNKDNLTQAIEKLKNEVDIN